MTHFSTRLFRFGFAALFILATAAVAHAEPRTALVIGNAAYADMPLNNPVNDAADMASALKKMGFEVLRHDNADQKTMKNAILEFGDRLGRERGVGLFYFSGHGVQVRGVNYLVPVGAVIRTESDVKHESVEASRVLGKMEDAGNRLNIVVLDACRDNPFARGFESAGKGLVRMDAPDGAFIWYATAPGEVTEDVDGRNGRFTKHLLKQMTIPGLKIEDVFKRTRLSVMEETSRQQVPWDSSSLTDDFYFVAATEGQSTESKAASPPPDPPKPAELTVTLPKISSDSSPPAPVSQEPNPGEVVEGPLGMTFAWIPPGEFLMGSPENEPGRCANEKQHQMKLTKGFWMQTTEVTVSQWKAFVRETGYRSEAEKGDGAYVYDGSNWEKKSDANWKNPYFSQTDEHPATCVSWNNAQDFMAWLERKGGGGYRLPTEAEWEYAARAGTATARFWGNDPDMACRYANVADQAGERKFPGWTIHDCDDGVVYTAPVGQFGANVWGLRDMIGNVWEWCADWGGDYPSGAATNPTGPATGADRVLRGGSWFNYAGDCRAADRDGDTPSNRGNDLGFRALSVRRPQVHQVE